jgi:hypothetical protein
VRHRGKELALRPIRFVRTCERIGRVLARFFCFASPGFELLRPLAQLIGKLTELMLACLGGAARRFLSCQSPRVFQRAELGCATLGEVARDLGKTDELTGFVANGGDRDARPEDGSIPAHPPAFLVVLPGALRDLELALRLVRGPVFFEIELREMPADYLLGSIPFDPLRALIPRRDASGRVEHEDGVVPDAFDEEAEALLTFPQRLFGFATLSEIAGDLCVAQELAFVIAQGGDDYIRPESGAVLPYAPAFILESTRVCGGSELELGESFLDELARVEDREMLADDLVRLVTLEPLGAGVPAQDHPVGIQSEDRVIADAFDEQPVEVTALVRDSGQ